MSPTLEFRFKDFAAETGIQLDAATLAIFYDAPLTPEQEKDGQLLLVARKRLREGRKAGEPIGGGGAIDIPQIEEELRIGGASKHADAPYPLDYAWFDPGAREFIVVDEKVGKAFVQRPRADKKLGLEEFEILSPTSYGYRAAETEGKHIVLSRREKDPNGIDYKVTGEVSVQKAWVVKDSKGRVTVLQEVRRSPAFEQKSFFELELGGKK